MIVLLLCNTAQASDLWKEYKAHEQQRLYDAGGIYLQEAVEDAVYPEYVLKKLDRQIDIHVRHLLRKPHDVDCMTKIRMLEKAREIYKKEAEHIEQEIRPST